MVHPGPEARYLGETPGGGESATGGAAHVRADQGDEVSEAGAE